ncbi:hypothetical protein ACH5RR_002144 [Cinchona calisaya]|uniref:DNA-directed DNA polymerase n=1 Tax=Cinchona calisaya TaxID=153742 RepID=A0ABD3B5G2_9GENT
MTKAKAKKQSKIIRFLKAPIKILNKLYMNSMYGCAGRIGENTAVVSCSIAPQVYSQQLPRNFSVSSSNDSQQEEELRELIRAVSTKLGEIKTVDAQLQKPRAGLAAAAASAEKRSYSVGIGRIGRIDEDMPCDFKEADANNNAYPRCKSYAVTTSSGIAVR